MPIVQQQGKNVHIALYYLVLKTHIPLSTRNAFHQPGHSGRSAPHFG